MWIIKLKKLSCTSKKICIWWKSSEEIQNVVSSISSNDSLKNEKNQYLNNVLNVSHWGTKPSKFTLHSTEEHKSTSLSLEFITLKIDHITSEEKIKVTLRSNYLSVGIVYEYNFGISNQRPLVLLPSHKKDLHSPCKVYYLSDQWLKHTLVISFILVV